MPRCEDQVVLMIVDISGRPPLGADSVETVGGAMDGPAQRTSVGAVTIAPNAPFDARAQNAAHIA
jgi:hypothetical protein